MKHYFLFFIMLEGVLFFLAPMSGYVKGSELSPERLNLFDRRGYFTPGFKVAIHELVETQQALSQAAIDEKKFKQDLPDLQKRSAEAEAKVGVLQKELALYDHPEEKDFANLQAKMNDAATKVEDQIILAQAYVWAYPTSSHQAEAQQDLQQLQKKLADQQQAAKDAEAARQAAWAKLVQRAQAKDLSMAEWKDFMRDMSQEDVLKYLGKPSILTNEYWIYKGNWTIDPMTGEKVGLRVDFNGTRVLAVVQRPNN